MPGMWGKLWQEIRWKAVGEETEDDRTVTAHEAIKTAETAGDESMEMLPSTSVHQQWAVTL